MDIRELWESDDEAFNTIAQAVALGLWVALPVKVEKDSEDGHVVSVKSTVKGGVQDEKGATKYVDMPLFEDVPIHFTGGGGVTLTHAVKKDDEGIILFASRSFDAWHQSGGQQNPIATRAGSQSDGFYIPGVRSTPRKLKNWSGKSTQMRSDDGKHFVDIDPAGTITTSVDGGKHVTTISKDSGISHKSSVNVHVEAPTLTSKGGWKHDGSLHATKTVQSDVGLKAPMLGGSPGDPPDA